MNISANVKTMEAFCTNYSAGVAKWSADYAQSFLLAALIIAAIWAALEVIARIISMFKANADGRNFAGDGATSILDAVTKLIAALANAPAWFALFVAGLALLLVSPIAVSGACPLPVKQAAPTK
jgi:hypothetical protein